MNKQKTKWTPLECRLMVGFILMVSTFVALGVWLSVS